jgi:hypothetical protein
MEQSRIPNESLVLSVTLTNHKYLPTLSYGTYTGVPGGKVNILGGHSIGHSKKNCLYQHVSYSERFPVFVEQYSFPSHRNAPKSQACKSVCSVSWLL